MNRQTRYPRTVLWALLCCLGLGSPALAQAPDWSVNPGAFSEQMTLTAQLFVQGSQSFDPDDLVAAFAGGEVRGVAAPLANGFVLLTVYANTAGEAITFQAYDADADADGAITPLFGSLTFVGGCLQGTPSRPYVLSDVLLAGSAWAAPDAATFNETMSVTAQRTGAAEMEVTKIGAFVGGDLRGVATGDLTGLFTINVYDEALPSDCPVVQFWAYEAATGQTVGMVEPLAFEAGVVGTAANPLTLTIDSSLPVALVSFEAVLDGPTVLLSWETASEHSNGGFFVEHQPPGSPGWAALGFVEGHGTTAVAQRYAYRTATLASGVHRFRLRQVDLDGTVRVSEVVTVAVPLTARYRLGAAYPNPFTSRAQFQVSVREPQVVRVTVHDVLGRERAVLHEGPLAAGIPHAFWFEGRDWPAGLYFYRVAGRYFLETRPVVRVKD